MSSKELDAAGLVPFDCRHRAIPPLSVVMPTRNAEPWLEQAVRSILAQSYRDFEFVILDDASEDTTRAIILQLASEDSRIRVLTTASRMGPVGSSNYVVEQALAPVIARMDADDVASPRRLEQQMRILEDWPNANLVGTLAETIDVSGRRVRPADYTSLFRSGPFAPFPHPSIMFRKDAFQQAGGYRAGAEKWEDIDLYLRMASRGEVLVVAKPLMAIRQTGQSTRFSDGRRELLCAMDLMHQCIAGFMNGEDYTDLLCGGAVRDKFSPEVFLSVGSASIWAGTRPRILLPMLQSARLQLRWRHAALLCWAIAGDIAPRLLRSLIRNVLSLRNYRTRKRLGDQIVLSWHPRRTAG